MRTVPARCEGSGSGRGTPLPETDRPAPDARAAVAAFACAPQRAAAVTDRTVRIRFDLARSGAPAKLRPSLTEHGKRGWQQEIDPYVAPGHATGTDSLPRTSSTWFRLAFQSVCHTFAALVAAPSGCLPASGL
jgi:hypothetical protein